MRTPFLNLNFSFSPLIKTIIQLSNKLRNSETNYMIKHNQRPLLKPGSVQPYQLLEGNWIFIEKHHQNSSLPSKELIQACVLCFLPALTGSKVIRGEVASPSSFTALTYISISEKRANPERGMIQWFSPGDTL